MNENWLTTASRTSGLPRARLVFSNMIRLIKPNPGSVRSLGLQAAHRDRDLLADPLLVGRVQVVELGFLLR